MDIGWAIVFTSVVAVKKGKLMWTTKTKKSFMAEVEHKLD